MSGLQIIWSMDLPLMSDELKLELREAFPADGEFEQYPPSFYIHLIKHGKDVISTYSKFSS